MTEHDERLKPPEDGELHDPGAGPAEGDEGTGQAAAPETGGKLWPGSTAPRGARSATT